MKLNAGNDKVDLRINELNVDEVCLWISQSENEMICWNEWLKLMLKSDEW